MSAGAGAPFAVHEEVLRAAERLRGRLVETPVVPSPWLSAAIGAEVRLKLENVQRTGSFKARGAWNRLLALDAAERARGVVAASSGNHGLALADAAKELGVPASVFVPASTPAEKRAAIGALGAEVAAHGTDCADTEAHARGVAAATGRTYVSPYNDPFVIAGQGTVAEELLRQWPEVEVVYVAVGGGGLLAGMAGHGRSSRPRVEWVACSPAASPALEACVREGAIVSVPCGDTLSDSTHGNVEPGSITFPLCRDAARRWLRAGEPAIAAAMRGALARQHLLVEGAAAVAIACCLADRELRGRRAAVVVCGANVPFAVLQRVLAGNPS